MAGHLYSESMSLFSYCLQKFRSDLLPDLNGAGTSTVQQLNRAPGHCGAINADMGFSRWRWCIQPIAYIEDARTTHLSLCDVGTHRRDPLNDIAQIFNGGYSMCQEQLAHP